MNTMTQKSRVENVDTTFFCWLPTRRGRVPYGYLKLKKNSGVEFYKDVCDCNVAETIITSLGHQDVWSCLSTRQIMKNNMTYLAC